VANDTRLVQPHSVTGLPFDHTVDFFRVRCVPNFKCHKSPSKFRFGPPTR